VCVCACVCVCVCIFLSLFLSFSFSLSLFLSFSLCVCVCIFLSLVLFLSFSLSLSFSFSLSLFLSFSLSLFLSFSLSLFLSLALSRSRLLALSLARALALSPSLARALSLCTYRAYFRALGDDDGLPCEAIASAAGSHMEEEEGGREVVRIVATGDQAYLAARLPQVDAARVLTCRTFETRGVVYSAYDLASPKGLATLLEMRHSIFSLRSGVAWSADSHSGLEGTLSSADAWLGVTVVTDVDVDAGHAEAAGVDAGLIADLRRLRVEFLHVDAEDQLHSAYKLRAMVHSPYKRTLYLDKDTVVCQSVSEAFELMPRFDWIATQASASFYEGQPEAWSEDSGLEPVPLPYIQYCAAVIFYRQSARVRRMLHKAHILEKCSVY